MTSGGGIVNVYFLGSPGKPWALVDAGMPGSAGAIKAVAEARYGAGARPEAIVLTHGHFDHVSSLRELADGWDVPVYASQGETPFLTGKSAYPPFDPTVGGFFPFLSRFFPTSVPDFSDRLRLLPDSGPLPGLPEWEIVATPGHSPGHISLFRASDRTLIAGDACITMNTDSVLDTLTRRQQVTRPPTYATCDWDAARSSVQTLAALKPLVVATGHGTPMVWPDVPDALSQFAEAFPAPTHGRYVPTPAVANESGIVSVPPPEPDPLPLQLAIGAGIAALALIGLALARRSASPD